MRTTVMGHDESMPSPSRLPSHRIEAIPENLLREPIDYLYADHFRQRVVCKFLDDIAFDPDAAEAPALATVVLDYLEWDLPRHIDDEERDLFPLMRARCESSDNVESLLSILSEEHAKDEELSSVLMSGLRGLAEGREPKDNPAFLRTASSFAESQRRHLAWEERLLLPLARQRLSADDLMNMGRNMAARRNVTIPAAGPGDTELPER